MTDIWAVLTNNTAAHRLHPHHLRCARRRRRFLIGISWYQLWQRRRDGIDTRRMPPAASSSARPRHPRPRPPRPQRVDLILRIGAVVAIVGFGGSGPHRRLAGQAHVRAAADEDGRRRGGLPHRHEFSPCSRSATSARPTARQVVGLIEIPACCRSSAHGDFDTEMHGHQRPDPAVPGRSTARPCRTSRSTATGPATDDQYLPLMEVTYWGFRLMIGLGGLAAFAALVALWLTRKGTVPRSNWIMRLAILGHPGPVRGATSPGWIFTEIGRQPFVVAPNPTPPASTACSCSPRRPCPPASTAGEMLFSLITLALRLRGPDGRRAGACSSPTCAVVSRARCRSSHEKTIRITASDDPDRPGDHDVLAFAY